MVRVQPDSLGNCRQSATLRDIARLLCRVTVTSTATGSRESSSPRLGSQHMSWPDAIDEVLGGDLTAALAYSTPAGGAVATAVAPLGLRDRENGTVSFTTSLGFGRKLDRISRDPRVALAYHAREHGHSESSRYVLVQGTA